MKFILLLACLAVYVACIQAQDRCRGRPIHQVCHGGRDEGNSNARHCSFFSQDRMWYYNSRSRSCIRMRYRGCGGNNNRYCSLSHCQQHCRR